MPRRPGAIGAVVACTVGNFVGVTPALHAVFGLYLIPISAEFRWPRAAVSGVLGVIALTTACAYPLIGRLADRFGARRPILLGNLAFAAALALVASTRGSLGRFYFLFFLVGLTSAVPSAMLYTKVLARWFDRRRGVMLGIAGGIGNGAGATLMPILAATLIGPFGWRGADLGIALIVAALGFPVLYLMLHEPAGSAAAADLPVEGATPAEARRDPVFWMVLAAIALGAGSMTALFGHVVPILAGRGFDIGLGTAVVSVFALVCAVWQPAMGHLLDRTASPRIAVPFYLVPIAGLLLLQRAESPALLLAGGALMGIGLGTEFGALPYFLSRYFGNRAYGAISGIAYATVILAQGVAPFFMDRVYDARGSYDAAIGAVALLLLAGSVVVALLPPYRRGRAGRWAPAAAPD